MGSFTTRKSTVQGKAETMRRRDVRRNKYATTEV